LIYSYLNIYYIITKVYNFGSQQEMDSARKNIFEEYKNKGNKIMHEFDSFKTFGEILQNG
jgi:hypothetical protein